MLKIDVTPLRAAASAMKNVDLQASVTKGSAQVAPRFAQMVAAHASTAQERRMIHGTATVTATGVHLSGGGGTLSGGLSDSGPIEWGGRKPGRTSYTRRTRRGKTGAVTRNTTAQLRPYNSQGYVFTRALSPVTKALLKAWMENVKKDLEEAVRG